MIGMLIMIMKITTMIAMTMINMNPGGDDDDGDDDGRCCC